MLTELEFYYKNFLWKNFHNIEAEAAKADKPGFLKTTDQPNTYHRPTTKRPTDHRPPIKCTDHRLIDHRAVRSLRTRKKIEFIFDINYDFKYRVFEIMLYIMHIQLLGNIVVCLCFFFLFSRKASMKKFIEK